MSYFLQRESNEQRPLRTRIVPPTHDEHPRGKRRNPALEPVVQRGEHRDEVIERKLLDYQQGADGAYIADKFSPSSERTAEDMQRRHPDIQKHGISHIFEAPQPDPVPVHRLRPVNEEHLRQIHGPSDNRKDVALQQFCQGPTLVEKMMQQNYPSPRLQDKQTGRCHVGAMQRNLSQIPIGGVAVLPPNKNDDPQRHRRQVDTDYTGYIPDKLLPRRFYTVDGKQVVAQDGVSACKNFFSGEPLLCGKYMIDASAGAVVPASRSPQQQPDAPPVTHSGRRHFAQQSSYPDPPHRRPFEHGHAPLQ